MRKCFPSLLIALFCFGASAQNTEIRWNREMVLTAFKSNAATYGLSEEDVLEAELTDFYKDRTNGAVHAYIQQYLNGLPLINNRIGLHFNANNKLVYVGNSFVANAGTKIWNSPLVQSPDILASKALQSVNIQESFAFDQVDPKSKLVYSETQKIYYPCFFLKGENLYRANNFIFYDNRTSDWWNIIVAEDGTVLDKISWTSHCVDQAPHRARSRMSVQDISYNTLSFSTESPLYGNRSVLLNPNDSMASPFGWQDTDGIPGVDNTTTKGNNVLASEDRNADNIAGFSPDGGASLSFDFSYDITEVDPVNYQSYAITNLFVGNNLLHDILYGYGFDEVAGNFQFNTYNRGGAGSDEVNADAQDGSGTNNANFSTPPDGSNPRMQMYIWDADAGINGPTLAINSPGTSKFRIGNASFGSVLGTEPITGKLVLVNDAFGSGYKGCGEITNGLEIEYNIAAIRRGDCLFTEKVYNAQLAGAIAVVILDTFAGDQLFTMSGSDSRITIPAVIAKYSDANALFTLLQEGEVNISLYDSAGLNPKTDSDLDMGVIAHEYTHGVSNRLTCGPSNTSALNNAEQMGEGWSDYIGLALTIKSGDFGSTPRGIGNWLIGQDESGGGIRTYPYTTNMAKNPMTYRSIQLASSGGRTETHYLGEVWCSMLWDLHWKMVEKYGYDNDLFHGTGGNNMAIRLVLDGMKMQKCNPGFVDGRNAIIMADSLNFDGANNKLIWEVFARRGLGFSASQGSSFNTADGTESFDMPGTQTAVTKVNYQLVSIRPNPATTELIVEPASVLHLDGTDILDILGNKVLLPSTPLADGAILFDLHRLSNGIYFLRVQSGADSQTLKIIKN